MISNAITRYDYNQGNIVPYEDGSSSSDEEDVDFRTEMNRTRASYVAYNHAIHKIQALVSDKSDGYEDSNCYDLTRAQYREEAVRDIIERKAVACKDAVVFASMMQFRRELIEEVKKLLTTNATHTALLSQAVSDFQHRLDMKRMHSVMSKGGLVALPKIMKSFLPEEATVLHHHVETKVHNVIFKGELSDLSKLIEKHFSKEPNSDYEYDEDEMFGMLLDDNDDDDEEESDDNDNNNDESEGEGGPNFISDISSLSDNPNFLLELQKKVSGHSGEGLDDDDDAYVTVSNTSGSMSEYEMEDGDNNYKNIIPDDHDGSSSSPRIEICSDPMENVEVYHTHASSTTPHSIISNGSHHSRGSKSLFSFVGSYSDREEIDSNFSFDDDSDDEDDDSDDENSFPYDHQDEFSSLVEEIPETLFVSRSQHSRRGNKFDRDESEITFSGENITSDMLSPRNNIVSDSEITCASDIENDSFDSCKESISSDSESDSDDSSSSNLEIDYDNNSYNSSKEESMEGKDDKDNSSISERIDVDNDSFSTCQSKHSDDDKESSSSLESEITETRTNRGSSNIAINSLKNKLKEATRKTPSTKIRKNEQSSQHRNRLAQQILEKFTQNNNNTDAPNKKEEEHHRNRLAQQILEKFTQQGSTDAAPNNKKEEEHHRNRLAQQILEKFTQTNTMNDTANKDKNEQQSHENRKKLSGEILEKFAHLGENVPATQTRSSPLSMEAEVSTNKIRQQLESQWTEKHSRDTRITEIEENEVSTDEIRQQLESQWMSKMVKPALVTKKHKKKSAFKSEYIKALSDQNDAKKGAVTSSWKDGEGQAFKSNLISTTTTKLLQKPDKKSDKPKQKRKGSLYLQQNRFIQLDISCNKNSKKKEFELRWTETISSSVIAPKRKSARPQGSQIPSKKVQKMQSKFMAQMKEK